MYAVTGVSGNTGSVVASALIDAGKSVRVIVRDAAKGASWKARGAEVAVAGLDDANALTGALRGAEGAYLLLPPQMESTHVRADNGRRTESLFKAASAAEVKHVVFLSSIAAQHAQGTGPITAVHDAEASFAKLRADVTFLRAAYFMENLGGSLYALPQNKLPTFLLSERKVAMVATRDIGTTAAKFLLEGGRGKRVVQLAGPREYSPADAAAALTRILGRTITVEQSPDAAMAGALQGAGVNAEWAGLYQEMTHALNIGYVAWEAGQPLERGSTELDAVLAKLVGR